MELNILENIIKNPKVNSLNNDLKKLYLIIKTAIKDIEKNNEKLQYLLNDNQNIINKFNSKNIIKGILDIKLNEINKNNILFNTDLKDGIDVYLNNKKIKMKNDDNKWMVSIDNFPNNGKYIFGIIINKDITSLSGFFEDCSIISSLDLSNFDTSKIIDMTECSIIVKN